MATENQVTVHSGQNGPTAACWSCGEMRAAHFCQSCGKLQPAIPTDYFSFFGLPRKLNIDGTTLEREFYRLSRKLHPDLYVLTTDQEQRWSLEKSSQLNDAYRTLKDPITRTAYLLRLEGVQLEEQSQEATRKARESGQEKKQVVPPDLLEEVFELNMQLEELKMNKQMGEEDEDLTRQLRDAEKAFQQKLDASTAELKKLWDEWDALPSPEEANGKPGERVRVRDKMVDLLNRRKYLMNLVSQVEESLSK